MPLNVRRLSSSIFLVLSILATLSFAQTQQAVNQPNPIPAPITPVKTPTAGDVMRERISKAKAFIAVRNYNAAIYELEMIRRETSDQSVHSVTNILLMNSYLEQGNYKKAQDFLNEFHRQFKGNNPTASAKYAAVAGQVVKGAKNQTERYRSLGLSVSDRNLPLEAVNDIEKMREMLELVITQTKETTRDKVCTDVAIPLLEEATAARSSLGRDEYDAKRWRDAAVEAREDLTSSRSVVINATDGTTVPQNNLPPQTNSTFTAQYVPVQNNLAASTSKPVETHLQPATVPNVNKPADNQVTASDKTADIVSKTENSPANNTQPGETKATTQPAGETATPSKSAGPIEVGSLLAYVTKQAPPTYPAAARTMRAAGVVKVEVVVDEKGDVTEVKKAEGHQLLQGAAKDAIRKWKFRPIMRDGQAVRASGFVNFNFSL